MLRQAPAGGFVYHYDPAIALPFRALTEAAAAQGQDALWQLYDAIAARTLLVRGADSDLLSHATAQEMTRRGPRARLVELAGIGHAPTLVTADQVDKLAEFLLAD
jgi:pimeloyl-ACP methyl ester carboxylesterase